MLDETHSPGVPQAAERILQDERLTTDLEDTAAAALLQWATGVAQQVALARVQCGPPPDRAAISEAVGPVRRVARAVNDLVAQRAELDEVEFLRRLLALLDAARQLPPLPGP